MYIIQRIDNYGEHKIMYFKSLGETCKTFTPNVKDAYKFNNKQDVILVSNKIVNDRYNITILEV